MTTMTETQNMIQMLNENDVQTVFIFVKALYEDRKKKQQLQTQSEKVRKRLDAINQLSTLLTEEAAEKLDEELKNHIHFKEIAL